MTGQEEGVTRTEVTRRRLMDASLEAFARHGVHETRVDDICELAGTARATFYRHFDGKSDVFAALFDEMSVELRRIASELGPVGADAEGLATLRTLVSELLAMSRRWTPVLVSLSGGVDADPDVRQRSFEMTAEFCNTVGARLAEGSVPDVDHRMAALALVALVEGVGQQLRTWSVEVDRGEVVGQLALEALVMLHGPAALDEMRAPVAHA